MEHCGMGVILTVAIVALVLLLEWGNNSRHARCMDLLDRGVPYDVVMTREECK